MSLTLDKQLGFYKNPKMNNSKSSHVPVGGGGTFGRYLSKKLGYFWQNGKFGHRGPPTPLIRQLVPWYFWEFA